MKKLIINGPNDISGEVEIQGEKNASNKLILLSLLADSSSTISNVPHIGTLTNMANLIQKHGGQADWLDPNTVRAVGKDLNSDLVLNHDDFYYTSGGIHLIPIMTSKYGEYTVPYPVKRGDVGGDDIGGREIEYVIAQMLACGIESKRKDETITFKLKSEKGFKYHVPKRSFAASINTLIAALFKKGRSEIIEYTTDIQFQSILEFLIKMGADIEVAPEILYVNGGKKLHGVEYINPSDRNDFATWVALALAADSKLLIKNIDYDVMGLESMEDVIAEMNAELVYEDNKCLVKRHHGNLKPVEIFATRYPEFQTEWQVVFGPVLTQIEGTSTVLEGLYPNRLRHFDEMGKMGAIYEFFEDDRVPRMDENPRAVKVYGPTRLQGAKVVSNDLRAGVSLVIAGAIADGVTEIVGVDHIFRGYENLVERLRGVGVDIELV